MHFPIVLRRVFAAATAAAAAGLPGGCRSQAPETPTTTSTAGASESVESPADQSEAAAPVPTGGERVTLADLAKGTPPEKLTPQTSGPGVVVCEPVAPSAKAGDFAAGCGRWLHLVLGGHGEMGQTPLWSALERGRRELGKPNLRLAPPDAFRLAGMVGATHVVTGTRTGDALRFQLHDARSRRAVGAPVVVAGSETQIVAGLPEAARLLARRLGVGTPQVPPSVGLAPDALARIGSRPAFPERPLPADEGEALRKLAPQSLLAELTFLNATIPPREGALPRTELRTLASLGKNNCLVLGEIGRIDASVLVPLESDLRRERRRFPRNYALAHAEVWLQRARRDYAAERSAAEAAVRSAPRNPEAWLSLAWTLSSAADAVRRGRLTVQIAREEGAALDRVYGQWLQAAQRSTELDPSFGTAWLRLATAATFAGERQTAENAFWKAERLKKGDAEVLSWGLQMFHPKWGGSRNDLARIAGMAASQTYPTPGQSLEVAQNLEDTGFPDRARELRERAHNDSRALVAKNPDDPLAHSWLASALQKTGRAEEAVEQFRAVVLLRPGDAGAHYDLGRILDDLDRHDEAMQAYREALRLNPSHPRAHYDLGWNLKNAGQLDEAEKELRAALRNAPEFAEAYLVLGDVYYLRGNKDAALPEYEKAVRLHPAFPEAWERLCSLYSNKKQGDRAVQAGRQVVLYRPENSVAYGNLSNAYIVAGRFEEGVEAARESIRLAPQSGLGYQNLGESLIGLGRKAEARAAWEKVLTLDNGDIARAAREMLDRYP